MPTKTQTPPSDMPWNQLKKLVSKIIRERMVRFQKFQGKTKMDIERPMRFTEFAQEIGFDTAQAWNSIRGKINPSAPLEAAVREWVSKQEK